MAPKLMRLASIPKIYIRLRANRRHKGMTEATTSPERKFPNNNTTTKMTMRKPRIRFSETVKVVLAISSLRSKTGFI